MGSNLYAVAAIVPNTADFIGIINRFSILLHVISLVIAVVLLYLLVKHITNPLRRMERFSQEIARQEYGSLHISTRDELEHVADSMNQMSISIQQYQKMLQAKNQQMEQLLNDVAHDLKTPISLIGMYSSGIQDGLDDGTFLETIIQQNNRMSQMTERLLNLSGIERKHSRHTESGNHGKCRAGHGTVFQPALQRGKIRRLRHRTCRTRQKRWAVLFSDHKRTWK